MHPRVVIDGRKVEGQADHDGYLSRYLILVGGHRIHLQPMMFRMMTLLAIHRQVGTEWVDVNSLCPVNAIRYCYRLKSQVRCGLKQTKWRTWPVIENNHGVGYRLRARPADIYFPNLRALREFGDHDVALLLDRVRSMPQLLRSEALNSHLFQ